jgi:hypothetical protein
MYTIQSMSLYLCILKLYDARPCAHARLCMLFLKLLGDIPSIQVYLDDILITSNGTFLEHAAIME